MHNFLKSTALKRPNLRELQRRGKYKNLSHYVMEVYSPGNLPNKPPIFIAEISYIIIIFKLLLLKWILKNKIIIRHWSAEPEKVLIYF
jgi:hypothetical protein